MLATQPEHWSDDSDEPALAQVPVDWGGGMVTAGASCGRGRGPERRGARGSSARGRSAMPCSIWLRPRCSPPAAVQSPSHAVSLLAGAAPPLPLASFLQRACLGFVGPRAGTGGDGVHAGRRLGGRDRARGKAVRRLSAGRHRDALAAQRGGAGGRHLQVQPSRRRRAAAFACKDRFACWRVSSGLHRAWRLS